MALFAPEIVLYTAYTQYSEARKLVKELNRIRFGDRDGPLTRDLEKGTSNGNLSETPVRFGLRYGFFVVMGGCITKNVEKISDRYTQATVTSKGAIALARNGIFIDIPSETISDKSKANLFGKGLVCIQATWFIIQCVARVTASYPLVLIELHTMVHVACALVMYILWWEVCLVLILRCQEPC